jgi:hypothetical protein
MVHRLELKQRKIMKEIDEWLISRGYDVEHMREMDSFQVFLEHGEYESEEQVINALINDLEDYKENED